MNEMKYQISFLKLQLGRYLRFNMMILEPFLRPSFTLSTVFNEILLK